MTQEDIFPLAGGMDLVTPAVLKKNGRVIASQNYEPIERGYGRWDGYERLDGQPKPSEATYTLVAFDAGSVAISEGDVVTGATSGATGTVIQDATVDTGSWGGSDAAGEFALVNWTGTFSDDENLQVSAVTRAVANGASVEAGASTDALDNTYTQGAIEKRRTDIAAVTGSGAIRGVATYKGDVYAWRDNAGATACVMHKATTAGWVAQTFGSILDFDAATGEFGEGETLTGATSLATATIERVAKQSGDWVSTGAGYLVLSGITGAFLDNELISDGGGGGASANGVDAAITLPAGGTYRTKVHNFYATALKQRLYGVNGVGYGFEWDGTVWAPVKTGTTEALDKPKHIAVHHNHLFLGYDGGSVQFSDTGYPLVFDGALGAGGLGFGDDITGLLAQTRGTLIIGARNSIGYVTGSSSSDFLLNHIADDAGVITGTLDLAGGVIFMDDRGVREMETAEAFGDWNIGTRTQAVKPWLDWKESSGYAPIEGIRVRKKDQYRLYFDDGAVLIGYFGRGDVEFLPCKLAFTPSVLISGEDASGDEILLAGDDSGYVYELDAGTSHDGASVESYLRLAYTNQGMPNWNKRYHQIRVEGEAFGATAAIYGTPDFSYGNSDQPIGVESGVTIYGGGAFWDETNWDEFQWDSGIASQAFMPLDGIGENLSFTFMSDATYEEPHVLSVVTIIYSKRGRVKNYG